MTNSCFIVIVIIAWSAWGIFEKKALNSATAKDVILMLYALRILQIPALIYVLNILQPNWHLTPTTFGLAGLASVLYAIGIVSYITAMSKAEASLVIGFTALYPIVSIFLAVPLLGEKLLVLRFLGALISVLGVIGMGLSARTKSIDATGPVMRILPCIAIATIAWGVWGLVDKQAISQSTVLEFYLAKCLWDIPFLILVAGVFKKQNHKFCLADPKAWWFCAWSTICLALGSWSYLSALTQFSASYVISICACYPIGMYMLSILFLKEKFDVRRLASLSVAVIGAIVVQITHVS